jgi:phosphoesterase RecJ-like protein
MNYKKLQGHFINNFKVTNHGVAYMMNTTEIAKRFDVSTFTVSRAMVNQMAGIKGIYIWANFTETEDGEIWVELRSHKESIVHLAREYGGGGHALACGCTLSSFKQAEELLEKLDTFNKGVYYG